MILSENNSSVTTSTNAQVKRRKAKQTTNSSNGMPYQVPKKIAKQYNLKNGNTKILTSPNRFVNLRLQDSNRTDNPLFILKPILVPHESV